MEHEYIPKSIFLINPDRLLSTFSIPLITIYFILSPIVKIVISFSKFFIKDVLNQEYSEEKPVFKITDLNEYVKKIVVSDKEIQSKNVTQFFNNALNLKVVRVRDCMIPRTGRLILSGNYDDVLIVDNSFILIES